MKLKPKNDFLLLPNALIQKYFKELDYSDVKLLLVLFFLSGRFSTDKFYHRDKDIEKKFGISRSTIKKARKKLKEKRFIDYRRGFKIGKFARATRYRLLPDDKIRKDFRIGDGPK
jgi:transcription initiation factor IIE alpha subunit